MKRKRQENDFREEIIYLESNKRNYDLNNRIPRVKTYKPIKKIEPNQLFEIKYELPKTKTLAANYNLPKRGAINHSKNQISPLDIPIERCPTHILKQRLASLKRLS